MLFNASLGSVSWSLARCRALLRRILAARCSPLDSKRRRALRHDRGKRGVVVAPVATASVNSS